MGQKAIPAPVVATVVTLLVVIVGFLLYKGATGGTVGTGTPGQVLAAPPMPNGASQKMQGNGVATGQR